MSIRLWPVRGQHVAVIIVTAVLFLGATTLSLPRLSVEHSAPCKTCHINPNGGGMRTEFGNQAVALNELCIPQTKSLVAAHAVPPRIGKALLVGFDSRYLVFDDGRVLRMQTDVYTAFNPFKNFYYQFRFWEAGISESYALLYLGDEQHHLKVGRFYPAFGLHDADHTAYVRERTGHPPNLYLDGVSLGFDVRGVNLTLESFNVDHQNVLGAHLYYPMQVGPLGLLAGSSVRISEKIGGTNRQFPHAKALFGAVSYDRLTLMGEFDVAGRSNDSLVAFGSLTGRVIYGLYLIGEYNFFDGDRHAQSGVDEFVRLSAEVFPLPYVEVRPSFTRYTRGARQDENDFFVQLHFGY